MSQSSTATRVQRWERRTEIPLLLLAVAFLVAYAVPVVDERVDGGIKSFLIVVSWSVWAAFAVDFAARLWLADQRASYARSHWYDVALVVVPMLRPLRLLRLLALARVLNRSATGSLVGKVTTYAAGVAVMSVGLGSLAMLDAEQDAHGANITTFGDSLWWACETVTTVGYGDRFPVTTEGRLVAVALMIVGIGFVGAVIASVAAWMVGQVGQRPDDTQN
jgi:voltage-gated potassium channel